MNFNWLLVYEDSNQAIHVIGCNSEPGKRSLVRALEKDDCSVLHELDMEKSRTPKLLARAATIVGLEQNLSPRQWAKQVVRNHLLEKHGEPVEPESVQDYENKLFKSGL